MSAIAATTPHNPLKEAMDFLKSKIGHAAAGVLERHRSEIEKIDDPDFDIRTAASKIKADLGVTTSEHNETTRGEIHSAVVTHLQEIRNLLLAKHKFRGDIATINRVFGSEKIAGIFGLPAPTAAPGERPEPARMELDPADVTHAQLERLSPKVPTRGLTAADERNVRAALDGALAYTRQREGKSSARRQVTANASTTLPLAA